MHERSFRPLRAVELNEIGEGSSGPISGSQLPFGLLVTSLAHMVCPLDTTLQLPYFVVVLCCSCAEGPSHSPLSYLSPHTPDLSPSHVLMLIAIT